MSPWLYSVIHLFLNRNDPNELGCADGGDGQPGPCPMKDTVGQQAQEGGMEVEMVVVGVACDRLVMIACGEKNSLCFLYDISNIRQPDLKKVFSLSPVSENISAPIAYDQRTLGDVDPETTLFLTAEESPTGKTAVMFGGAISGTLSLYEFECEDPSDTSSSSSSSSDAPGEWKPTATTTASIVFASLLGFVVLGVL